MIDADLLIDRRKLKRRLTIWRIVAVLALVGAALLAAPRARFGGALAPHIARYAISGMIGDGEKQAEELDRLRRDAGVRAVLLHLDTPGGAASGGEALHNAVADLARAKPVVTVMDGVAASAGYMIAVATPHIVARGTTITGSIGVLAAIPDVSGLLDKVGVHVDQLVSGPLKGQPSGTAPLTPEARSYLQGMIMDMYAQFVDMVATGRHLDQARVRQLADGRAYTGRQALSAGLVDELGGEGEARRWLETNRHVSPGLPIVTVDERSYTERLFRTALADFALTTYDAFAAPRIEAVWHPATP